MKSFFDLTVSLTALIICLLPILFLVLAIRISSNESIFFWSRRVGVNNKIFYMPKFRTMRSDTPQLASHLMKDADNFYTPLGRFLRKSSLDELPQLISIIKGDMSLVGPRPNVKKETDLYTDIENDLLSVKPGITDISSIVFSDEGDILADKADPDLAYNQLIRPWKSRLGLIYIKNQYIYMKNIVILING